MSQRGIVTAPVARDLVAEASTIGNPLSGLSIVKILRATNGTLQAYSTNDANKIAALNDPAITIYTTWNSVPLALRKFLLIIRTRDASLTPASEQWLLWADCDATRFTRTWSTLTGTKGIPGVLSTKAVTAILGTDRFTDDFSNPAHTWFGVDDTPMGGNG